MCFKVSCFSLVCRNFLTFFILRCRCGALARKGFLWDAAKHMGRVKSLRNGSGAAATAARAGAAVWAWRPAAGEESAAALEQQRAMAAIRAIFSVLGCA